MLGIELRQWTLTISLLDDKILPDVRLLEATMDNGSMLRVARVATELKVSEQTVRRMADAGELPVVLTDGGHRRFRKEDVLLLKAERLRKQIEDVAEAAEFFEDSSPSQDGRVKVQVSPGMSFADLVRMNSHIAEGLLRDLYPRLEQFTQGAVFEAASRFAQQWAENPMRQDAFRQIQSLTASPDIQAAMARTATQITALGTSELLRDAMKHVTEVVAPSAIAKGAIDGMRDQIHGLIGSFDYQIQAQQIRENLGSVFGSVSLATVVSEQARLLESIRLKPETFSFLAGMSEEWSRATFRSGLPLIDFTKLFPPIPLTFINEEFLGRLRSTVEAYGPTFDRVRRAIEEDEQTIAAFEAIGWPVAPSMPRDLKQRVVQFQNEDNKRGATLAILGYYRRDRCAPLADAIEGWAHLPQFEPRMKIIRDAFWAHLAGKYTLSVPAVLPQAEGVMFDVLGTSAGKPHALSQKFVGSADEWFFHLRATTATLLSCLLNNTYNFIPFEHERLPHRRQTNRHSVSHGVTTAYATEAQSVRAFLLLDAIASLVEAMDDVSCLAREVGHY